MSPILVRPVREQFEHDRVIRLLQARYKRKYEVAINPGAEQNSPVEVGELTMFPDLVLFSDGSKRLQGTVEVETGESVTTLEAMAQWGPFSRLRAPFFLYEPPHALDTARRLCTEHNIEVTEIWTYHTTADHVRFTMVHRVPESAAKLKGVEIAQRRAPEKSDKPDKVEKKAAPKAQPKVAPATAAAKKVAARPATKPAPKTLVGKSAAAPVKTAKKPAKPAPKAGAKKAAKKPVKAKGGKRR